MGADAWLGLALYPAVLGALAYPLAIFPARVAAPTPAMGMLGAARVNVLLLHPALDRAQ